MADGKYGVKPRYDRVIIRKLADKKQTDGGLFIPDTAQGKDPLLRGEVLSIGEKVTGLSVGDIVGYSNGAGDPIATRDNHKEELLMIRDVDLPLIFTENEQ